jgi:hypothetical protein
VQAAGLASTDGNGCCIHSLRRAFTAGTIRPVSREVVEMERDTHRLIHEMNLAYLLLVQRLLVEDKALGMNSLGVSSEVADLLVALSLKEIARLASVSQIL